MSMLDTVFAGYTFNAINQPIVVLCSFSWQTGN
jgi:hypothetical protein